MKRLKEFYLGAKIDEELFKLCLMEVLRERLRTALMGTYFAPGYLAGETHRKNKWAQGAWLKD
jgi:hypothetical protein